MKLDSSNCGAQDLKKYTWRLHFLAVALAYSHAIKFAGKAQICCFTRCLSLSTLSRKLRAKEHTSFSVLPSRRLDAVSAENYVFRRCTETCVARCARNHRVLVSSTGRESLKRCANDIDSLATMFHGFSNELSTISPMKRHRAFSVQIPTRLLPWKKRTSPCVPMVLIGLGSTFLLQCFSPKSWSDSYRLLCTFDERLNDWRSSGQDCDPGSSGDQFGLHPRKYGTLLTPSTCLHSNVSQFNLPERVGDSNDRYPSTRSNHASLKRCKYRKRLLTGNSLQYVKYEEHEANRADGERR